MEIGNNLKQRLALSINREVSCQIRTKLKTLLTNPLKNLLTDSIMWVVWDSTNNSCKYTLWASIRNSINNKAHGTR
jgi:hypothetical protein